ncbi:MAG TPA: transglycosylase domain-containing protein [Actinomycetota bacterium]|nr:transglycosylase domain-containing protein [Actinomycetota bacterium]
MRHIRHRPRDVALALALVLFGVPAIALACAFAAFLLFPPPVSLPQPQAATLAQTSHIYAADGSLLASLHAQYNREPVSLDQIAPSMQHAIVASEDATFYSNSGIDVFSILRALLVDLKAKKAVQGASTITEEYAKIAYTGSDRSLFRKFRQALLAAQLDRTYSKSKILESYLNSVYFGDGAYGVEAAAQTYFGVHASQLTLSQSAMLVGIVPAPSVYSPISHPALAEQRRQQVLNRMVATRAITADQAAQAKASPPPLVTTSDIQVTKYPAFVDAVETYLVAKYGKAKVFSGGLEVTTTLNPTDQQEAETVLATDMPNASDPDYALASVDPTTGYITALVGGRNFSIGNFNIAIQGRRQPGSAFKPFTLVTALENGISPSSTYAGPSNICLPAWKPTCVSNFDNESFGTIPLSYATWNSVNTVYAQVVVQVGPQKVVNVANAMGIPGPSWLPPRSGCTVSASNACGTLLTPLPSITLGSEEVTPLEMASAYATLAAGGIYRAPKLVSKVVDASGDTLEQGPSGGNQVVSPQIAYTATSILEGVITQGTGTAAGIGRPAAGKTGTASDYKNAWFVGYTPDLSTAIWMGYKSTNAPLLNIHGVGQVTGGTWPAKMWSTYMKAALTTVPPTPFTAPTATVTNGFTLPRPSYPVPPPSPSPSPTPTSTFAPLVIGPTATVTPTLAPSPTPSLPFRQSPSPRGLPPPSPSTGASPSPVESPSPSPSPSPTGRRSGSG